MSIKQAFFKSNESSLNKKDDVVELDLASNHINDTLEVHEVSITREVREEETLLGLADLDAVKKGVSNVQRKEVEDHTESILTKIVHRNRSTVVCMGLQLQYVNLCPPFLI